MPGLLITTAGGSFGIGGSTPEPVGSLTVEALSTSSLRVSWGDGDAQALAYLVERSADNTNWTTVEAAATSSPVTDTGLSTATLYYYRVTPSNIWGDGSPVTSSGTTESSGAPTAPSGLMATTIGPTSIGLAWTDNSNNEDNFELQRATENTFASPTTLSPAANAIATTSTGLANSTEYFFRIRAVNGSGNSSWSSTISATTLTGGVTGIAFTALPDADVGITSTLTANFGTKWMWPLRTVVFGDSGAPSIVVGTHQSGGCAVYDRTTDWLHTHATGDYGRAVNDFRSVTGGIIFADLNHDGDIDWGHFGEGSAFDDYYYDAGSLTEATTTPWGSHTRINEMYEQAGTGYLGASYLSYPDWPTSLSCEKRVMEWNGSDWDVSYETFDPPSGIPSGTLTNMQSYLDDGSQATVKRYLEFAWKYVDLTGDGSATDLVVSMFRGYYSVYRSWFLTNNGDGTFTEQNASWGLPTADGVAIFPGQFSHQRPFGHNPGWVDLMACDFAGTGRPDLFLSTKQTSGNYHGHYRWNGSSYTRLTSSPITVRMGRSEEYAKRLYLIDLGNRGCLDIVLQWPRLGAVFIYVNDGSGTFTELMQRVAWDADGFDAVIDEASGLVSFAFGGDGGVDSGVTSKGPTPGAKVVSIYENTTTNPGNYLGIKLRRTGHANKFGVGAKIEVFEAGQSFAAAALIRRWYARPDGQALIFGVGSEATIDRRVTWPDGTTSTATGVSVNQIITVTS